MAIRSLTDPKIDVKLSATNKNILSDSTPVSVAHPSLVYNKKLTNGVDAEQANRSWQSLDRKLSNGAEETIDLFDFGTINIGAGAGLDGLGQTLNIVEIVAIAIVNTTAIAKSGLIEIQPGTGSPGWGAIGVHTEANGGALTPQGLLLKTSIHADGFAVTDGTNHTIKIRAVNGSVTYSIYLIGRDDTDTSSSSSSSSISTSSSSQSGVSSLSSGSSSSISSQSSSSSS